MLDELLGWYLAPWRRMGRVEFGIFLAAASVPGFLLMITGFAGEASGWLAPIADMMNLGKQVSQAAATDYTNVSSMQSLANQLNGDAFMPTTAGLAQAATHFDWAGLMNNGLQLLMIPLCRMRLRDMGKTGWTEKGITAAVNVAAVDGMMNVFGLDFLPLGWAWGVVSFGGFIWLCMAPSLRKVAPDERIPAPQQQPQPQQQPFHDDPRRQDP